MVHLDIEGNWAGELGGADNAAAAHALEKYAHVLKLARSSLQYRSALLGQFDLFPSGLNDWLHANEMSGKTQANYAAYQERNKAILAYVDVLFPAFYAWENSFVKWQALVDMKLQHIQQYAPEKPVYGFFWGRFADWTGYPEDDQLIPNPLINQMLDYLDSRIDGVILWDRPGTFTYADPWLTAIRDRLFPARAVYR